MQKVDSEKTVDFVGIGVPRAGTTWVATCLQEHPNISMPKQKETHFFSHLAHKGISYYKSFFNNLPSGNIWGEFSVEYYMQYSISEDLLSLNPDIKILVCLRNPVDMIFSLHQYVNTHFGYTETLEERLRNPKDWVLNFGYYFHHLNLFLKPFDMDRVHFVFLEDVQANPQQEIFKLYTFLGIDADFVPPSLNKEINCTVQHTYHSVHLQRIHACKLYWRQYKYWDMLEWCMNKTRLTFLMERLLHANIQKNDRVKPLALDPTIRQQLLVRYQDDVSQLSSFLGRDLSSWIAS